jgi:hypothetical protein
MLNGSNLIEISKSLNKQLVDYSYSFHNNSARPFRNGAVKTQPPHNFTLVKSSAYNVLYREFVDYALHDFRAIDLLNWGTDTFSPDEWFVCLFFFSLFYFT